MSTITFKDIIEQISDSKQVLRDLQRYDVVKDSRAEESANNIRILIADIESSPISTWTRKIRSYYHDLIVESQFLYTLMWKEREGRGDREEIRPPQPTFGRVI